MVWNIYSGKNAKFSWDGCFSVTFIDTVKFLFQFGFTEG